MPDINPELRKIELLKARITQTLLSQFKNEAINPITLAAIADSLKRTALGWAESHSKIDPSKILFDIRTNPGDPTNVLITPKTIYTGLVFLGHMDYAPEEVEAGTITTLNTADGLFTEFTMPAGVFHLNYYPDDNSYRAWFVPTTLSLTTTVTIRP